MMKRKSTAAIVQQLEKQLTDLEQEREFLMSRNLEAKKKLVKQAHKRLAIPLSQLTAFRLSREKKALDKIDKRNKRTITTLNLCIDCNTKIKDAIARGERKSNSLKANICKLEKRIQELNSEISKLQRQSFFRQSSAIRTLVKMSEASVQQEKQTEISSLKEKIAQLTAENNSLKKMIKHAGSQFELATMNDKGIRSLYRDIRQLKEANKSNEQKIKRLHQQLQAIQKATAEQFKTIIRLSVENPKLEKRLAEKSQDILRLKFRLTMLKARHRLLSSNVQKTVVDNNGGSSRPRSKFSYATVAILHQQRRLTLVHHTESYTPESKPKRAKVNIRLWGIPNSSPMPDSKISRESDSKINDWIKTGAWGKLSAYLLQWDKLPQELAQKFFTPSSLTALNNGAKITLEGTKTKNNTQFTTLIDTLIAKLPNEMRESLSKGIINQSSINEKYALLNGLFKIKALSLANNVSLKL